MARTLVLGASGFLGRWLCCSLARRPGFEVVAPTRPGWDLRNPHQIEKLIAESSPDILVNLAGISDTTVDKNEIFQINAFGHLAILEALRKIRFSGRLYFVSSGNVYGDANADPLTEETPPQPLNHYSCSKLLAEHFCSMFKDDFCISVLRPFSVIGIGQAPRFVVPKLVTAFVERAPELVLGNLEVRRDFVDVRDLTTMVALFLESRDPPPYGNLANAEAVSLGEVISLFEEVSGHSPNVRQAPELMRARDLHYQRGDNRVIRSLGYQRTHSIKSTIEWIYRSKRAEGFLT